MLPPSESPYVPLMAVVNSQATSTLYIKEEIEDWQHPSILDAINNVPIRTYYWRIDKDAEKRPQQIGIIAEELEAGGLEEYVDYDWFEDPENPEGDKLWMTYESLTRQTYSNWEWVLVNDIKRFYFVLSLLYLHQ